MKIGYILIALALITLTSVCRAQNLQNDRVLGNVKEVCYYSIGSNDSVIGLSTMDSAPGEYWVDSFGNNTGDKLCSYWVRKGIVTRRVETKSNDTATFTFVNGTLAEQTPLKSHANVNLAEEQLTNGKYKKLIYDSAGRIIMESYFDCNDRFTSSTKHIYAPGQLEITEDSAEGGTIFKRVRKYDEKGQVILSESEFVHTDCPGKSVYEYTYDDKGNKTSETDNGGIYRKTTWEYDEHNNVVLEKHYDINDKLTVTFSNEYIYDVHGNWIRRIKNGRGLHMLVIRYIEYY